ncbi:MAG: cytochrome c, partial [Rubripirellula sp.]
CSRKPEVAENRVRQWVAFATIAFSRLNECSSDVPQNVASAAVRYAFPPLIAICLLGCDARIERFEPNEVYSLTMARSRSAAAEIASEDAADVVEELYGTPDDPKWPLPTSAGGVKPQNLLRAAGSVSSEKDGTHLGLFREHCVTCHGLSGSGTGPASVFQNPYPRDFRHGVFKWKSTDRGSKPTKADIRKLLLDGIPGTAMPSFALLSPDDLDALVDYVIYLASRGEVERRLTSAAIDELDYDESRPETELVLSSSDATEGGEVVAEVVSRVASDWAESEAKAATSEMPVLSGEALNESVDRGRDIFHGKIANCVGCHGPAGNGNVPTLDYDDWTKEYSTKIGLTPSDREAMRPFREAGALRPRPIQPRNLQDGVFRGGGDAASLYQRISQGIAGTPMPAVEITDQPTGTGLSQDQAWDLIRYVQSLSKSQ